MEMNRNCYTYLLLGLFVFLGLGLTACSAIEPKPKEGRCAHHTDCPDGFQCKDTYCEDMYFPRREIKPY